MLCTTHVLCETTNGTIQNYRTYYTKLATDHGTLNYRQKGHAYELHTSYEIHALNNINFMKFK